MPTNFSVAVFIAKFRLKLKKVGKITRWFRYDLNQIPYDYTVEVKNRFKGLDLIDRVDWGSWHCTGDRDYDHPQGKEMEKSKMVVWGGLANSCEKKRREKQRRNRPQGPCRVGTGESGLVLSEEGNAAGLSSCSGKNTAQ